MAKITPEAPVKYIQGKLSKSDKAVFRVKRGKIFCNMLYNPSDPSRNGTDKQKAAMQKFKETQELVTQVYADAVALEQYREAFLAQTRYTSLRDYIFSKLYKISEP